MNDYHLWQMWWLAALYGMGPDRRMAMIDAARRFGCD
jgi:hypothetical protein